MADEKNQNDQVKDLLARLRSQMSQLDEMFGLGDTQAKSASEAVPPAVPEEDSTAEKSPFVTEENEAAEAPATEEAVREEAVPSAEPEEVFDDAEAPLEKEMLPDEEKTADEEMLCAEEAVEEEEVPSSEEIPTEAPVQIDLFEEIDAFSSFEDDEKKEEHPESGASEKLSPTSIRLNFDDALEDDAPIFSIEDTPVRIQKERIVAESIIDEHIEVPPPPIQTVIVTEAVDPLEAPREKNESHTSYFVPNEPSAEEEAVVPAALSPFSPERRFDPAKYDAMLAAYEKRKAEAFEDHTAQKETAEAEAPVLPIAPVLMPRTTSFVFPEIFDEDEPSSAPAEEMDEDETEAACEEFIDEIAADTVKEPVEEISAEPEVSPALETPTENETILDAPAAAVPPEHHTHARVVLAQGELSDNERDSGSHESTGRVHLAPTAYRAAEERVRSKSRYTDEDDDEDFMEGLPSGIRDSLIGFPLGRPNRAQGFNLDVGEPQKNKKKRKTYRFPEELEGARDEEDAAPGYVRHHLKETLKQTRARLIVITVLAFILLLLENISLVQGFVPPDFVEVQTAGIIDAILLLGAVIAAWPRLHVGLKGIFHGRVLPESILLVESVLAFAYAVVLGALGVPTMYLSFVPALGLSLLYYFRVLRSETDLHSFEKIHMAGDKLIFSPAAKKDIVSDSTASGKSVSSNDARVYRAQKTAVVRGFSERSGSVCEDEWLNLGILLSSAAVGAVCFLFAYFAKHLVLVMAIRAALFGCFLAAPLAMLGVHAYAMHRADAVAGADSAIAGEASIREALNVQAVAFEDIEAAPSSGVVLSGIRVHCDDPTAVFKYLTALYGHIGGPLCGRFSGMYGDKSVPPKAAVDLVSATRDGVSAVIDGAEIVVGNGQYMTGSGITPSYDPEDEKVLSDGRSGVLYIAVNGMVCMKFYMEHRISAAFEKSVLRLHRLGIATILRTYDPNFNEKTVARSQTLRECRTQVVGKTVAQRNDYYAEQAEGGVVTSKNSAKLLRLLLLCFRTGSMLRFGRAYKLVAAILGGIVSVALCAFGVFAFLPSVYLALYHLVLLAVHMLTVAIGVKLPEISEGK